MDEKYLLRTLLDLSPDAVIVIDLHDPNVSWPIIDCNAAACRMNGFEREELIGHSIDILNVTEGTEEERATYLKQLREAGTLKLQTLHHRKDGGTFPVEISTTLIKVGQQELVIGIDRDISDRVRMEAELLREKQFLETINQTSPVAIVILDNDQNQGFLKVRERGHDLGEQQRSDEQRGQKGTWIWRSKPRRDC